MDTLKANTGCEFCPHRNPPRVSIQGSAKPQGPKSLQVLGTIQDTGPSIQISKALANKSGAKGVEGLGNGGNILGDAIRNQKKPWWAPIFKFSSEGNDCGSNDGDGATKTEVNNSSSGVAASRRDRRATVFTDEKARLLRRESRATESWHDLMYHSAIASRMACPDHDSSSS